MKRSMWLRVAALVTLLYAIGHTIGFPWTPVRSAATREVIDAMRAVRFVVDGTSRSYWDFYEGFGLAISGLLTVQAVILWQLASLARAGTPGVRGAIAAFLVAFAFNAAIVDRFFFAKPMVLVVAIVTCLSLALFGRTDVPTPSSADPQGDALRPRASSDI